MIEDKLGYLRAKPEVFMPAVASVTFDLIFIDFCHEFNNGFG